MKYLFNQDFRDFLQTLNSNEVEYILVGGYSVILHGHLRNTGDMDLWINKTPENYQKLVKAFHDFGMPIFDMSEDAFIKNPDLDVFTFGRPPVSIDIMTAVKGLEFNDAFKNSIWKESDGLKIRTLSLDDLFSAKKASGRSKDKDDISHLK